MFTQRSALLGFVAFCFYLIAVVNSLQTFYYVLTWLALSLSGASFGLALLSLSGLQSHWSWGQLQGHAALSPLHPAPEDAAPSLEMTFQNNASLGKTGLLIEIHFDGAEEQSPPPRRNARRSAQHIHSFLVEAIPAGQSVQITIPLQFLPRGQYRLGEIKLVGSDVLGVFRVSQRLPLEAHGPILTIGPAILGGSGFFFPQGAGRALEGTQRVRALGRGDEVRGTRSYVAGDDLRHIHWKSTARTGQLTVREWEDTAKAAALLVWDGVPQNALTIEVGLCLFASLAAALGRERMPRALVFLGKQSRSFTASPTIGTDLCADEMQALALAAPRENPDFALAFARAVAESETGRYNTIALITGPYLHDDASRRAQVESWLAFGARVTILWLEVNSSGTRGHDRKKNESLDKTSAQQRETLSNLGAHCFRLQLEDQVPSPEQLRNFLLQLGQNATF